MYRRASGMVNFRDFNQFHHFTRSKVSLRASGMSCARLRLPARLLFCARLRVCPKSEVFRGKWLQNLLAFWTRSEVHGGTKLCLNGYDCKLLVQFLVTHPVRLVRLLSQALPPLRLIRLIITLTPHGFAVAFKSEY